MFKPHLIWATEFSRPSSITMAILYGIPRLLRIDLDLDRGEETFVSQAIAAMPATIHFFGKATGVATAALTEPRGMTRKATLSRPSAAGVNVLPSVSRPLWQSLCLRPAEESCRLFRVIRAD
jgi:hypothetical protein